MSSRKFDSTKYWEKRYFSGGNSGTGSYGKYAEFKAEVINKFIVDNNINSLLDFGVGDGNQLKLISVPNYIGVDIAPTVIAKLATHYKDDNSKTFYLRDNLPSELKADLTISCDVLYHLINKDIFINYLHDLFNNSNKFVIIYAADWNKDFGQHMKCRKFTTYIKKTFLEWALIEKIPNKYPYDEHNMTGSVADFFIYQKLDKTDN